MPADRSTILVVDDEREMLTSVAANVEAEGYRVLEAAGADEALQVVSERPGVDLALVDIRMPRMDGVEALRRMKRLRPDLPVILMTAYAIQEREVEGVQTGAYTVIRKPFDMDLALKLIARALRNPAVLVVSPDANDREATVNAFTACAQRAIAAAGIAEAAETLRGECVDVAVLSFAELGDRVLNLTSLYRAAPSLSTVLVTPDAPRWIGDAVHVPIATWVPKRAPSVELVRVVSQIRSTMR